MKKILTAIISGFVAIAAAAQTSRIEVSFIAHAPNMSKDVSDRTYNYILRTDAAGSKFFSPMTEYIDSLNSSPAGAALYKEMARNAYLGGKLDEMPRRDGSYYALKSFADSKLTYYDTAGLEKYVYEETPGEFDWEIGDSTKVVLGYECVMASTDFHGRHWTVWFSPEIPVADGPWKFCGLPGLILEATADGGQYSFVATGIEQTPREVGSVYLAEEYERTTRKEFLKARRAFLDNPLGQLNAQLGGIVVKVEDKDGAPAFAPASVVDFIETDYH